MRTWIKILIFLIPAIGGTIFVFWRLSPKQAIIRRANVIFASLEKKTLSSGTPTEKAERFREVLSPEFEIKASKPVPSGTLPPEEAADNLRRFLENVMSCRISRKGVAVAFPSDGLAIYEATVEADVTISPNNRPVMRYRCRFEFEKSGRDWLLRLIVLTPI